MALHSSLQRARQMTYEKGRLKIVFGPDSGFHYRMIDRELKERLAAVCSSLTSSGVTVEVALATDEDKEKPIQPTEEPAVQEFLRAFPGKYVVKAEN